MRIGLVALLAFAAACPKKAEPQPVPPAEASTSKPALLAGFTDVPAWASACTALVDAQIEDAQQVIDLLGSHPQLAQSAFWQGRVKTEAERLCIATSTFSTQPKPVPPEWAPALDHLAAEARVLCELKPAYLDAARRGADAVPELKRRLGELQTSAEAADDEVAKLRGAPEPAPR